MIWAACLTKAQGTKLQLPYVECCCSVNSGHIAVHRDMESSPYVRWTLLLIWIRFVRAFKVSESWTNSVKNPGESEICMRGLTFKPRSNFRNSGAVPEFCSLKKTLFFLAADVKVYQKKNPSWITILILFSMQGWHTLNEHILESVYCGGCSWAEPSVAWCNTQKGEIIIIAE